MSDRGAILRIVAAVFLVVAAWTGLTCRLVYLHLLAGESQRDRILKWRDFEEKIDVRRGRILDRRGLMLAMDVMLKDVCANPKRLYETNRVDATARALAPLLNLELGRVREKLSQPKLKEVYVARRLPDENAARIHELKLPGVYFKDTFGRSYPLRNSMCHVIGFVNYDRVGSAGLEQRLNSKLEGRPGLQAGRRNAANEEIYDWRQVIAEPQDGANVWLTINANIQFIVERALDKAMREFSARGAWCVVQEVRTGKILALASKPDFDPNEFNKADERARLNQVIGYSYEPGSTFKVGIVAAALNEGAVRPDEVFDCENGAWLFRGRLLHDYHRYGLLSVADIIKKSSNIGAAKVALRIGEERVHRYLAAFGIGQRTGIDLPGEEGGLLKPRRSWQPISISRIAMGHEVMVNSLQMLGVLATIANDGHRMRPYVVDRIEDAKGSNCLYAAQPEELGQPIRAETATTMRRLLARVTEEGGTGFKAHMDGYSVAGKTGTAQKLIDGNYSNTKNISSFVGFLPAEDPEIAMIVVMDEPAGVARTGGAVCAPVFKEIAEQAMGCLDLRPAAIAPAPTNTPHRVADEEEPCD